MADSEKVLGLFLNTLPIRVAVDRSHTWNDLVLAAFEAERTALPHRHYPLAAIQRHAAKGDLFDVAFNFTHFRSLGELTRSQRFALRDHEQSVETNFALLSECWIDVGTDSPHWTLCYDTQRLPLEEVERIAAEYSSTLEAVSCAPGAPIPALGAILSAAQACLAPEMSSRAPGSRTWAGPVHLRFAQQAALTPAASAVLESAGAVSYAELERRANRLARYLIRSGVSGGAVAGICVERSAEMVVAVLACLKAGAACLPLDPSYPAERLRFMVQDAQVCVVVCSAAAAPWLPAGVPRLIQIDAEQRAIQQEPDEPCACRVTEHDLAYLIYTSGSTGRPKGAEVTHGALAALIDWQMGASLCGAGTRTLQFAPLSFDVSFQELFSTLCCGGILVLVSEAARRDPDALLGLLVERQVARLFIPVVMLGHLAEALERGAPLPLNLREVITAGEALRITPAIRKAFMRLPASRLENQYGPSETHVVTAYRLESDPSVWPLLPPIGRAVAGAAIQIMDADGRPVAPGVPGEIWIVGTAVGRGYRRAPDLTADRYVPTELANSVGARAYRTGDIGRYRRDGLIEFNGRADGQVKIRGFRIELAEIEAVLGQYPDVVQAAAGVEQAGGADARLVAYIVAGNGQLSFEALRSFLADRLPAPMVPSRVVRIAAMPSTPSGKIDRRALSSVEMVSVSSASGFVAPQTPLEQLIADVFADVLGVARVGMHDGFAALGGHSLAAVRVAARLRDVLGVELPLKWLFSEASPVALATALRRRAGADVMLDDLAELFLTVSRLAPQDVDRRLRELADQEAGAGARAAHVAGEKTET
jgi:amino acid adenylation domain-containing protein